MTLAELKELKDKADSMVATLQNDRQVLVSTKQEKMRSNAKSLEDFFKVIQTEYFPLLPIRDKRTKVRIDDYINKAGVYRSWTSEIEYYCNEIVMRICPSGCSEDWKVILTKDNIKCYDYLHSLTRDRLIKYMVENVEELRGLFEQLVEQAIVGNVEDNKAENDELFEYIENID